MLKLFRLRSDPAAELASAEKTSAVALAPSHRAVARIDHGFDVAPAKTFLRSGWARFVMGSFLVTVAAPTAAAAIYLGAFASQRYTSEYRIAVRTVEPMRSISFSSLIGLAGSSQAGNDAQAVVQYLQSREPVDELDRASALRNHFASPSVDWLSRLAPKATVEDVTRYWRSMVDAYYENSTGTIIVRITAFSADEAFELANRTLALSEALVNRMSERSREDALAASRTEVEETQARLSALREKLRVLQDNQRSLDPRKTADSTLALASRLSGEIAQLKATMFEQRRSLSPDAPSLEANKRRLEGLENELSDVRSEITSSNSDHQALSGQIGAFEELLSDASFAEKAYQSALTSLESARLDAARQQVYLSTIVRPALPQEASFPRPLTTCALTFGIASMLWAVGLLLIQVTREHM